MKGSVCFVTSCAIATAKSINDNWSLSVRPSVRFNHLQEAVIKKVTMAKYIIEVTDLKY